MRIKCKQMSQELYKNIASPGPGLKKFLENLEKISQSILEYRLKRSFPHIVFSKSSFIRGNQSYFLYIYNFPPKLTKWIQI